MIRFSMTEIAFSKKKISPYLFNFFRKKRNFFRQGIAFTG